MEWNEGTGRRRLGRPLFIRALDTVHIVQWRCDSIYCEGPWLTPWSCIVVTRNERHTTYSHWSRDTFHHVTCTKIRPHLNRHWQVWFFNSWLWPSFRFRRLLNIPPLPSKALTSCHLSFLFKSLHVKVTVIIPFWKFQPPRCQPPLLIGYTLGVFLIKRTPSKADENTSNKLLYFMFCASITAVKITKTCCQREPGSAKRKKTRNEVPHKHLMISSTLVSRHWGSWTFQEINTVP
jgi:hypothetical protein